MNNRQKPPKATGIGERFRMERLRLGLTQQEMADAVGVARTTVAAGETGLANLMTATLADSSLLGVDVAYVLTGRRQGDWQRIARTVRAVEKSKGRRWRKLTETELAEEIECRVMRGRARAE